MNRQKGWKYLNAMPNLSKRLELFFGLFPYRCRKCSCILIPHSNFMPSSWQRRINICKSCRNEITRNMPSYKKTQAKYSQRMIQGRTWKSVRTSNRNQEIKKAIISHYSKGKQSCSKCGFADIRALTIDHIEGKGGVHRRQINTGNFYRWLIRNNLPNGYQILCMNCQFIKKHEMGEWAKR